MSAVQVGILGVVGAALAIQFKSGKSEYGIYISVAVSLLLFFCIVGKLQMILDAEKEIAAEISLNSSYIGTLVKMLGITYAAEFSAGICRDAGYGAIASQIEIFAKLAILTLGMPVLLTLLETIKEFLT